MVEQAAEQHGTEEVPRRKGQQVPSYAVGLDSVEIAEDERIRKKDRVVEEGLRAHEREAHERTPAMNLKQRVEHSPNRGKAANA